jgi:carbon storage regulator
MEGVGMLVLSRRIGEKIYIGDNITVTVTDIDRGKVRLGVEAPRDVPVFREELVIPAAEPESVTVLTVPDMPPLPHD